MNATRRHATAAPAAATTGAATAATVAPRHCSSGAGAEAEVPATAAQLAAATLAEAMHVGDACTHEHRAHDKRTSANHDLKRPSS